MEILERLRKKLFPNIESHNYIYKQLKIDKDTFAPLFIIHDGRITLARAHWDGTQWIGTDLTVSGRIQTNKETGVNCPECRSYDIISTDIVDKGTMAERWFCRECGYTDDCDYFFE
jgi:hypothetical protein